MGGVCPKSLANEHKALFVSGCINDLTNVRDVLFKGFGIPEGLLKVLFEIRIHRLIISGSAKMWGD
jgi:hypothetical protein